ncbi:MAG: DUF3617 family protein [Candidatus Limnocylindrales bacterium]|nr:DUF3617 family protein [Candidatus Limnocylindrales bacterium]
MKLIAMTMSLCAVLVTAVSAQGPMRAGRWEITTQMQMPNMPVQMPAMKTMQCITKEQLESSSKGLPTAADGRSSCKVSDYKVDGNKVTWNMECPDMTGTGEITFKADTYEGLMKLTTKQGDMSMKMSANRLGECAP